MRRSVLSLALVAVLAPAIAAAQPGKPLLFYSLDSSRYTELSDLMRRIPVQQLLLDLAERPRTGQEIDAALKGSGATLLKVEHEGLIRQEGTHYVVAVRLLTRGDIGTVRGTTNKYAASLAEAILGRRTEIEAAISPYVVVGVDPSAVAYVVLGCFSLDWDGLRLAAARGYLTEPRPDSASARLGPWWVEEENAFTTEKYFWGSHSTIYGPVELTSFGDHAPGSQPRWAFPDLIWSENVLGAHHLGAKTALEGAPATLVTPISAVAGIAPEQTGERAGLMMLALRNGPRTLAELAATVRVQLDDAKKLADLLVALQYATLEAGRYQTHVPVLTSQDRVMVEALRRIARTLMVNWLAEHYEQLRADLAGVTPWRSGQPFAESFYPIWHFLFGAANRRLVEAGLFADPYDHTRLFKGYIPAVFEASLYSQ